MVVVLPRIIDTNPVNPIADASTIADRDIGRAGAALARVGEQGRATFGMIGKKEAEARRTHELTVALTKAQKELTDAEISMDKDDDYETKAERFRQKVSEIHGRLMGSLDNATAHRFNSTYGHMARSRTTAVQWKARRQEIDMKRTALLRLVDTGSAGAAGDSTSTGAKVTLAAIKGQIKEAARTGIISHQDAYRMTRRVSRRYYAAQVRAMRKADHRNLLKLLKDPNAFKDMDPKQRQRLIERTTAYARKYAKAEKRAVRREVARWYKIKVAGKEYAGQEDLRRRVELLDPKAAAQMNRWQTAFAKAAPMKYMTITEQKKFLGAWDKTGPVTWEQHIADEAAGRRDARETRVNDAVQRERDAFMARQGRKEEMARRQATRKLLADAKDWQKVSVTGKKWAGSDTYKSEGALFSAAQRLAPKLYEKLVDQRERNAAVRDFSKQTVAEQKKRLVKFDAKDAFTAEDADQRRVMGRIHQAAIKKWRTDPAGYTIGINEPLRDAYAAAAAEQDPKKRAQLFRMANQMLLDAQKDEGVPNLKRVLLTKQQAKDLGGRILAVGGPHKVAETMGQLYAQYGKEHYTRIMRQLKADGKLSDSHEVIGSLYAVDPRAATMLAEAMGVKEADYRKAIPRDDRDSLTTRIKDQFSDFAGSLKINEGGALRDRWVRAGRILAYKLYTENGGDADAAARESYRLLIGNHYDFNGTVRVPKRFIGDRGSMMRLGELLPLLRKDLDPKKLDIGDLIIRTPGAGGKSTDDRKAYLQQQYAKTIANRGFWVTNADESGVILQDEQGYPVYRTDGKKLYIPFAMLMDRGLKNDLRLVKMMGRTDPRRKQALDRIRAKFRKRLYQ